MAPAARRTARGMATRLPGCLKPVKVALAGHDHEGGFRQHTGGVPFVTLPALLEAQEDGNAFALASVHRDRIVIDGLGTAVPSHTLPFRVG
jgi:hypothetical protein